MKLIHPQILFITYLASFLLNIQTKCPAQVKPQNDKKSTEIVLKLNVKTVFEDSLSITLNSFSHKRPLKGGPTKATAYLTVSKGNFTEKISLSVHGREGKTGNEEYDSLEWNDYIFELKELKYSESIRLKIDKIP